MKPVLWVTVIFLSVVALGHLARLLLGVEVVMAGWKLPLWWSGPAFLFTGILAVLLAREAGKA